MNNNVNDNVNDNMNVNVNGKVKITSKNVSKRQTDFASASKLELKEEKKNTVDQSNQRCPKVPKGKFCVNSVSKLLRKVSPDVNHRRPVETRTTKEED